MTVCALALLPYSYPKTLQAKGIKCKMFSPVKPALSSYQNNRIIERYALSTAIPHLPEG